MNRRNLFKLIAGASCAAAIELTGVRPVMPKMTIAEVNAAIEKFLAETPEWPSILATVKFKEPVILPRQFSI